MIKELIKSRPFILLIIEGGPPDKRIKSHFRDISARQLKRTESDDGDKGHLLYLCQNNEIVFHRLAKVDYDDLRAQLVAAQDKAQDNGRFRLWKGRVKKHEKNADK